MAIGDTNTKDTIGKAIALVIIFGVMGFIVFGFSKFLKGQGSFGEDLPIIFPLVLGIIGFTFIFIFGLVIFKLIKSMFISDKCTISSHVVDDFQSEYQGSAWEEAGNRVKPATNEEMNDIEDDKKGDSGTYKDGEYEPYDPNNQWDKY